MAASRLAEHSDKASGSESALSAHSEGLLVGKLAAIFRQPLEAPTAGAAIPLARIRIESLKFAEY
jgi:hypothetical protein